MQGLRFWQMSWHAFSAVVTAIQAAREHEGATTQQPELCELLTACAADATARIHTEEEKELHKARLRVQLRKLSVSCLHKYYSSHQ